MSKKLFGKILCGLFAIALVAPSAGAFDFKFDFFRNREQTLEEVKAAYDASLESFEGSKAESQKLFDDLNVALAEIDGTKVDVKLYFEKSNEQLKKLNEAYKDWADAYYPISGEKYDAYCLAKNEFDKASSDYLLKKAELENNFEKSKFLFDQYDKIMSGYMNNLTKSVCNYHNYGSVLIKHDMKKA